MAKKRQTSNEPIETSIERLHLQYENEREIAEGVRQVLLEELVQLIAGVGVVPVGVDSRIKEWNSISNKIERLDLEIGSLREIWDFVGLRVIVLFQNQVEQVDALLREHFTVKWHEDTSGRMKESEFGYRSRHYSVVVPDEWGNVPTRSRLLGWSAEIQVRTLAQHIWAASSHHLQYKREHDVPPPLRRSLSRISALLEVVDLELERSLVERTEYQVSGAQAEAHSILNVDILVQILSESYPVENHDERGEEYSDVLKTLLDNGIHTVGRLRDLIDRTKVRVEADERERVSGAIVDDPVARERISSGVYYTHVGLLRRALVADATGGD